MKAWMKAFRTLFRTDRRKSRRPKKPLGRRGLLISAAIGIPALLVAAVLSVQKTGSLERISVVFEPVPIRLFDTAPKAPKASQEPVEIPDPGQTPPEETETPIQEAEAPSDPTVLPYRENTGRGYLNWCVFLGDSRMVSMVHYGLINDDAALAQIGISHPSFKKNTFINNAGREYTLKSYLSTHQAPVIYIALGVNGINDPSEEHYKSTYIDLIDTVQRAAPASSIVLMSIGPVNDSGPYKKTVQNAWIRKYNEFLLNTAREKHLFYLDISGLLTGSDGQVKAKYDAGDGLHYSKGGCTAILDYLVSHPVAGIPDDGEYVVHYVKPRIENTRVTMDEGSGIDEEKLKELMDMMEENGEETTAEETAGEEAAGEEAAGEETAQEEGSDTGEEENKEQDEDGEEASDEETEQEDAGGESTEEEGASEE